MCNCAGRNPKSGGCPQGNTDHRTCLGGESACECLAESEARRIAAEKAAEPLFSLESDHGLAPEEELALDLCREEGQNHE